MRVLRGVQNETVRRNNAKNKNDVKTTTKRPATLVLNVLEAEHKLEEAREMLKNNNKDDAQQDENQTKRRKDLAARTNELLGIRVRGIRNVGETAHKRGGLSRIVLHRDEI